MEEEGIALLHVCLKVGLFRCAGLLLILEGEGDGAVATGNVSQNNGVLISLGESLATVEEGFTFLNGGGQFGGGGYAFGADNVESEVHDTVATVSGFEGLAVVVVAQSGGLNRLALEEVSPTQLHVRLKVGFFRRAGCRGIHREGQRDNAVAACVVLQCLLIGVLTFGRCFNLPALEEEGRSFFHGGSYFRTVVHRYLLGVHGQVESNRAVATGSIGQHYGMLTFGGCRISITPEEECLPFRYRGINSGCRGGTDTQVEGLGYSSHIDTLVNTCCGKLLAAEQERYRLTKLCLHHFLSRHTHGSRQSQQGKEVLK